MAHHIEATRWDYLQKVKNIFLIRDPARIIASYAKVIGHPSMRDIGIAFQFELFSSLLKKGLKPAVLDTALLLRDPESILRKLCTHLDIPFYPSMLHWEKGPKSYDGVWAKYWYKNVHQSTGFGKEESTLREVPGHLAELCTEARIVYEQFLPFSIKP